VKQNGHTTILQALSLKILLLNTCKAH